MSTPAITLTGTIGADNTFDAALSWSKGAALATSKDMAYRAGFSPIFLAVTGGKYKAPTGSEVFMNLPNNANNAAIGFTEGGLSVEEAPYLEFSLQNLGTAGKQTISLPTDNPNKISFALTIKPAGQFSGKLTVLNPDPKLNRTASYQGTIVRQGGTYLSGGYFLMPQIPQPGQTLSTSPVLSGEVQFGPSL